MDLHSTGACLCCTAAGLSGNWALPKLTITATSSPTPAAFMANLGSGNTFTFLLNLSICYACCDLLTYSDNDLNLLAVELRMGAFPRAPLLIYDKTVAQCELEPEECQRQKPHRTKEIICLPGNLEMTFDFWIGRDSPIHDITFL